MKMLFEIGILFLILSIIIPIIFIKKNKPRKISLYFLTIASIALAAFSIIFFLIPNDILEQIALGSFNFLLDRLSIFFIMTISIVSLAVSIYSYDYIENIHGTTKKNLITSLMSLFVFSMIGTIISSSMIFFLFFWELMSITSFFLVMSEYEKPETRKAGIIYFIMTQVSTVFIIFSFVQIFNATGSFDITQVALPAKFSIIVPVALFLGFGIKAGIIPFHKWLPYAHSAAPSNISALMSGVMIKVAIYGILRFFIYVLAPEQWLGILILVFGALSAILGVIYALKEHDIKRLLAYHSIENIGIILIGFGLYVIFQKTTPEIASIALAGSIFHTFNHAIFKSLLFMGAGSIINTTGTRNIDKMGGLIKKMPYTAGFFLIGAVSISALPPFNGFVSEFLIFQSFLFSGVMNNSPLLVILLFLCLSIFALTSALAAACFVKAFGITFLALPRSKKAECAEESGCPMLFGQFILAALCAISGILSFQIFKIAGLSIPMPDLLIFFIALGLIIIITLIGIALFANKKERYSETWGCGILSQNEKMEYTASGFSAPILTIFRPIYRTKKHAERNYFDNHKAIFSTGFAHISLIAFFEEYLYSPIGKFFQRISLWLSSIQDSIEVDSYLLHMLVAIVLMLLYAWWFI